MNNIFEKYINDINTVGLFPKKSDKIKMFEPDLVLNGMGNDDCMDFVLFEEAENV